MSIKVETETLSTQISILDTTVEQSIEPLTLQFSNNNNRFTPLLESSVQQLHSGMDGVQSVVRKLSTNAKSCKDAVINLDLNLTHEISNVTSEMAVLTDAD